MESAQSERESTPAARPGAASGGRGRSGPSGWASALGAVAVVLGLLLTASHANEWMKYSVIAASAPADQQFPAADCPEDELEEEGLSLAECEFLVAGMEGRILSTPSWFVKFQTVLSSLGTFLAAFSVVVGVALVDARRWAPRAAVATFAALMVIDVVGFIAVVNAGPIIRGDYLWIMLLWFALHLMMTVAVIAGRDSDREAGFTRSTDIPVSGAP